MTKDRAQLTNYSTKKYAVDQQNDRSVVLKNQRDLQPISNKQTVD